MSEKVIRIILTEPKSINGKIRNPGYVLLEGISSKKVVAADINKAIQLGQVKVEEKSVKKASKTEESTKESEAPRNKKKSAENPAEENKE